MNDTGKESPRDPGVRDRETIFIGVAWPYANGSIHLGHVAGSLLPPDIFSRFHRMKGNRVLMVSGSDEHGTPITVRAESEGKTPLEVVDHFHAQTLRDLSSLGIQFDLFTRTTHPRHHSVVQDIFLTHHELGYIYPKATDELFCTACGKFLPDRYVFGTCPKCKAENARGDQCDRCGTTYHALELGDPRCKLCGGPPVLRETEHFFFRLSAFRDRLLGYLSGKDHWKPGVLNFTRNWILEGLKDRPITRDITWGVPVPLDGYGSKRIYVWFDAVAGYLSASIQWAENSGNPDAWKEFWFGPSVKAYYFLGKDNIPFHTIIWPAMLMGLSQGKGVEYTLPYNVPANEYLQLAGAKFTKSGGIGIDVSSFLGQFTSDEVRYYLSIIMPENRDVEFDPVDFRTRVNNELVATLGNFIHRVLSFSASNFGRIPERTVPNATDDALILELGSAEERIHNHLARCEFKNALREIMALAATGNRYLVERAPWKLITTDRQDCASVMNTALRLTRALSVYAYPFLPEGMERLHAMLGMEGVPKWADGLSDFSESQYAMELHRPEPLFRKLDIPLAVEGTGGGGSPETTSPGQKGKEHRKGSGSDAPRKDQPGIPKKDPGRTMTMADLLLKVGVVLGVEDHPKADRLYVLRVDVGEPEPRTLVAGLRSHYTPDELLGSSLIILCNLRPAKLRGIVSHGMMLAASDGERVRFLTPATPVRPGTPVTLLPPSHGEPVGELNLEEFTTLPLRVGQVTSVTDAGVWLNDGSVIPTSCPVIPWPDPLGSLVIHGSDAILITGNDRIIPERPVAPGSRIR